jgi:hypothetical protein
MQLDARVSDIAHVIQLAVAPVFLLSGVGVILTVLTNRLARIIDRARTLQSATAPGTREAAVAELATLSRRAQLIHRAITLGTTTALLICGVILALFVGAALGQHFTRVIGGLFIAGMVAFIASLVLFLREIFLATASLRFSQH